jgi:hypothetical protein
MILYLPMQLAGAAGVAGRRHTEERVSPRGEPAIKNRSEFREWPPRKNGRQPFPARQHAKDFNPGKVAFGPASIRCARVHLVGHFLARVRRRALQNLRIVVVQPLDSPIAIQRLDTRAHPATEIAVAVRVDFDYVCVR